MSNIGDFPDWTRGNVSILPTPLVSGFPLALTFAGQTFGPFAIGALPALEVYMKPSATATVYILGLDFYLDAAMTQHVGSWGASVLSSPAFFNTVIPTSGRYVVISLSTAAVGGGNCDVFIAPTYRLTAGARTATLAYHSPGNRLVAGGANDILDAKYSYAGPAALSFWTDATLWSFEARYTVNGVANTTIIYMDNLSGRPPPAMIELPPRPVTTVFFNLDGVNRNYRVAITPATFGA